MELATFVTALATVLFLCFWAWLSTAIARIRIPVERLEKRIERIERRFVPPGF